MGKLKIGILGASGYTGADLVRLLLGHPEVEITVLAAHSQAGQPLGDVYPQFSLYDLPPLTAIADFDPSSVDVVFCGLPHGTTQEIVAELPSALPVIDLSADFRLRNEKTYAAWYGHAHRALARQPEAVYGLTEHYRADLAGAKLIACPGCYPTAALLALLPLVKAGAVDVEDLIIDGKSGATGAGRSVKQSMLFCEVSDGMAPYAIGAHRHAPEIEQEISRAAGRDGAGEGDITINFTPHLIPQNRGELLTIYVRLSQGETPASLRERLEAAYTEEPFVHVVAPGVMPATRHVRGSNHCLINVFEDRIKHRAILVSTLDNLVKGSSGQALQNLNVMKGWPETLGLEQAPLFP